MVFTVTVEKQYRTPNISVKVALFLGEIIVDRSQTIPRELLSMTHVVKWRDTKYKNTNTHVFNTQTYCSWRDIIRLS